MSCYEQFLNVLEKSMDHPEYLIKDEDEGYRLLSFGEPMDDEVLNITLIFYDDDRLVEIFVRRLLIDLPDRLTLLESLNKKNYTYRGMSFFSNDRTVGIKTLYHVTAQVEDLMQELITIVQVAKQELTRLS